MTDQEQIEEMAKAIKPILENRTDICFIPDLDKPIAKELLKHYQPKLPKDSVVLSREEYEMLANKYKNLEIKYSNLCDNYRLCKDANETLKQKVIIARKETAEKFYDKVNENICVFQLENKNREFTDGYAQAIADICGRLDQVAKQFGVEIKE